MKVVMTLRIGFLANDDVGQGSPHKENRKHDGCPENGFFYAAFGVVNRALAPEYARKPGAALLYEYGADQEERNDYLSQIESAVHKRVRIAERGVLCQWKGLSAFLAAPRVRALQRGAPPYGLDLNAPRSCSETKPFRSAPVAARNDRQPLTCKSTCSLEGGVYFSHCARKHDGLTYCGGVYDLFLEPRIMQSILWGEPSREIHSSLRGAERSVETKQFRLIVTGYKKHNRPTSLRD